MCPTYSNIFACLCGVDALQLRMAVILETISQQRPLCGFFLVVLLVFIFGLRNRRVGTTGFLCFGGVLPSFTSVDVSNRLGPSLGLRPALLLCDFFITTSVIIVITEQGPVVKHGRYGWRCPCTWGMHSFVVLSVLWLGTCFLSCFDPRDLTLPLPWHGSELLQSFL